VSADALACLLSALPGLAAHAILNPRRDGKIRKGVVWRGGRGASRYLLVFSKKAWPPERLTCQLANFGRLSA